MNFISIAKPCFTQCRPGIFGLAGRHKLDVVDLNIGFTSILADIKHIQIHTPPLSYLNRYIFNYISS